MTALDAARRIHDHPSPWLPVEAHRDAREVVAGIEAAVTHLEAIRDAACEEYQSPDLVSNPALIREVYGNAVAALEALEGET